MAYKKVSDLVEATSISSSDLFLLSDMLGLVSKKLTFETLAGSLGGNTFDLNGRFQEGSSWTINRNAEGLVSSLVTEIAPGVNKVVTFNRDGEGSVATVNIQNSDNSYDKTYAFVKDSEGNVTSINIT